MDRLQARLEDVMTNLPDWTHGVAIKSCPLSGVLRQAQKLGFGAECASMGEVKHALALGFEASKIIYDSPVKTKASFHSSNYQPMRSDLTWTNENDGKLFENLKRQI